MPELPEVEVTRLGLEPHLRGRRITAVSWSGRRLRRPMPRKLLREEIQGQRIIGIDRRAKYLLTRTTDGAVLVLHLGMTGRIGLFPADAPRARHDHLRLRLDNGHEMRFNDSRRFGMVMVWPAATARDQEKLFDRQQGIEPFGPEFTPDRLAALARGRRQPVKTFLMDSRIIAGIGNIYANEILFAAGLAPDTPVNRIRGEQWARIAAQTRTILTAAIEAGGSTISDFLGSSGRPGYFQLQLAVYDRAGSPCPRCATPIVRKNLAGRATFFCPRCQHGEKSGSSRTRTRLPAG